MLQNTRFIFAISVAINQKAVRKVSIWLNMRMVSTSANTLYILLSDINLSTVFSCC